MKESKPKIGWIDNLRALATFSVIIVHVAGPLLVNFSQASPVYNEWWTGNIYDSIVRYCVPVFVMLTGALLLGSDIPLDVFLKRRFTRIIWPFVFWSAIYLIQGYVTTEEFSYPGGIPNWIYQSFMAGVRYHMWFIFMIIGVYLFIPIINKWIIHATEKEIRYFLIIWLIFIVKGIPGLEFLQIKVELLYFSGYLGYAVLGYYLSVKDWPARKSVISGLFLFVAGVLITALGTYYRSLQTGAFDGVYYNYLSLNVLMAATGLFLVFKYAGQNNGALRHVISIISKHSYGIFLCHLLTLNLLTTIGVDAYFINPAAGIFITASLCLLVSLLMVWLVSKLPLGKYFAG